MLAVHAMQSVYHMTGGYSNTLTLKTVSGHFFQSGTMTYSDTSSSYFAYECLLVLWYHVRM